MVGGIILLRGEGSRTECLRRTWEKITSRGYELTLTCHPYPERNDMLSLCGTLGVGCDSVGV